MSKKGLKRLDYRKLEGTRYYFGSEGWGFESLRARQQTTTLHISALSGVRKVSFFIWNIFASSAASYLCGIETKAKIDPCVALGRLTVSVVLFFLINLK
jgi:hypothetical protein